MARKKIVANGQLSRRGFLRRTGCSLASVTIATDLFGREAIPPSERLRLAFIGCGGRGRANLNGLTKGNDIVGLCDVDDRSAGRAYTRFPGAKRFKDFRKMFDAIEKEIDVVAVSTPDHTHAVAAMAAIQRGKHVYCEKPLAHSVHEVRALMKAAREKDVVTQLGNQGHASGDTRKLVEWVRDGAIGNVHTVHASCTAVHCAIGELGRRRDKSKIPKQLDWDLWLGPAAERNYNSMYLPGKWRSWRPFGNGTIGDWVCHVLDPSFWALDLGAPESVKVLRMLDFDPVKHADTFARGSAIEFKFAAKGKRGPVTVVWHSGVDEKPRPEGIAKDTKIWGTGSVLIGDKGVITHGSHGAAHVQLLPEKRRQEYKQPPQTIPRTRGQHRDFLEAIKEGRKAGSDFAEHGGPLTELAMIGIIAMRFPGRKLSWNGTEGRFTDCDEANRFLEPEYRKGWSLSG
jgi:predicted dehydrogenase